jgi:hypothetical protein
MAYDDEEQTADRAASGACSGLARVSCSRCGHAVRARMWCHDPCCCDQDLVSFLGALAAPGSEDGVPAYAIRVTEDPGECSHAVMVRVWAAGSSIVPVFTGPLSEAQELVMGHACPDAAEPSQ